MARPPQVKLVEVGARDGLQNEPEPVATAVKIELIERLAAAGLSAVEAGSFVSPQRVPQMADTPQVLGGLRRRTRTAYPVLVPNLKGLDAALAAGVAEVAVFVSASEGFSSRNIACSRAESLARLAPVAERAVAHGLRLRGYVSCVIGCPYDGPVDPDQPAEMAVRLMEMGCYQVSLGDTIGVGTADAVRHLIDRVALRVSRACIAMHFHDTYGQAVANVLASLEAGIAVFDSSVGGLGGCPFATGATGNVATEDVLYLLQGLGIETGVDLLAVAETGAWISRLLGRPNGSRAGPALLAASGARSTVVR
ncbi:hydroxymethylglutaryl-CoA lyase [Telmatospirillum sp.]|uniref:hydroxymethylglutaryl-CoA lyase n=1 Tax=Telmatospirillum sp. TaxID=2079197 RepID=UPI00283DA7D7|nr:hydroxymethylglutaryl-CoA lyase [Telmatospirillum sp.]MDR3437728.1 hydroxymethylglutaryl-CoA lyase [Telmatospirillum sp.]